MCDERTPDGCPQSVRDPPTYCVRAAGVLKYNRESDNHKTKMTAILPVSRPLTEDPVKCEHCGEKAQPSLDLTWAQRPETVPHFCCAQHRGLCQMLLRLRCLVEGRCDLRMDTPTSQRDTLVTEVEDVFLQGKEIKDHNKFNLALSNGLGERSESRIYEDDSVQLSEAQTSISTSKVLSFRLSCAPRDGCWTVCPFSLTEKHVDTKQEEEGSALFCDHKPLKFSICHHQEFLQKYYSNGMKFLTVFPDGSAQVFYPSGLLALVIVVTEENGRVCIVYGDSSSTHQPIRAMFQSDGRATCYHSNGNIWLTLDSSGGQCLDEAGSTVRRWSWSSRSHTPSHLQPVFLSLNKTVGVRVLGKDKVFVSFLAQGQQAKFSVGSCCTKGEYRAYGAASKEELYVRAARIRIHRAIQQLHRCLATPSHHLPKIT